MSAVLKEYHGTVPPCGVFCGGCPVYIRERKPCPGAQVSQRCASRQCRFYTCAQQKGVSYCYECDEYPCPRFKRFAATWVKYGQDFCDNQKNLQFLGAEMFLEEWNAKAGKADENG